MSNLQFAPKYQDLLNNAHKSRRGSDNRISLIQLRKRSAACNIRYSRFWSRKARLKRNTLPRRQVFLAENIGAAIMSKPEE